MVRTHGPVVDRNDRWLVMELVAGEDLTRVRRPAEDAVLGWAREACEALDYIHAQQVVHRDVKPSNLILSPDGIVLVDFGIAREIGGEGTRIGTPLYVAPEVAAGHSRRRARTSTGSPRPCWRCSPSARRTPPPRPAYLRDALALDPAARPPSAAAFAELLGAPLTPARDELAVGDELLRAVVRATAAAFDAAAVSVATRNTGGGLTYRVAWGAGAEEIVGVQLPAGGGLAGAVDDSGRPRRSPTAAPIRASPPASQRARATSRTRCCSSRSRPASSRSSTAATAFPTAPPTSPARPSSPTSPR